MVAAATIHGCDNAFTTASGDTGAASPVTTTDTTGGAAGAAGIGGSGGATTTAWGGAGGGAECTVAEDCPLPATACSLSDCDDHQCIELLAAVGSVCDVDAGFCDGLGSCIGCGTSTAAIGGTCPTDVCTGGCDGSRCHIVCDDAACDNVDIACPDGFDCVVYCEGANSCWDTTVRCPDEEACTVNCFADTSCHAAVVECGELGPCYLNCTATLMACAEGTRMECGFNECRATCASGSYLPMQSEGCAAQGCGCAAVVVDGGDCPPSVGSTIRDAQSTAGP